MSKLLPRRKFELFCVLYIQFTLYCFPWMYCNVNAMLILIFGFIRGLLLLKYIVKYIFWIYILNVYSEIYHTWHWSLGTYQRYDYQSWKKIFTPPKSVHIQLLGYNRILMKTSQGQWEICHVQWGVGWNIMNFSASETW